MSKRSHKKKKKLSKPHLAKASTKIDLGFIFEVIENRGYTRANNVPSFNDILYEKMRNLYHASDD